jgi:hypothetical protein
MANTPVTPKKAQALPPKPQPKPQPSSPPPQARTVPAPPPPPPPPAAPSSTAKVRITKRKSVRQLMRAERPKPENIAKVKVRATDMGYYRHIRRRVGDVFILTLPVDNGQVTLPSWVEQVDPKEPLRITTGVEAMNEIRMQARASQMSRKQQLREEAEGEDPIGDATADDE